MSHAITFHTLISSQYNRIFCAVHIFDIIYYLFEQIKMGTNGHGIHMRHTSHLSCLWVVILPRCPEQNSNVSGYMCLNKNNNNNMIYI